MKKIVIVLLSLLLPLSALAQSGYSSSYSNSGGSYSEGSIRSGGYSSSYGNTVTYSAGNISPNGFIIMGNGYYPRCRAIVNGYYRLGEIYEYYCHVVANGEPIAVDYYEALDQWGRWYAVRPAYYRGHHYRRHFNYDRRNDGSGFNLTFKIR